MGDLAWEGERTGRGEAWAWPLEVEAEHPEGYGSTISSEGGPQHIRGFLFRYALT